jgi:splicing factor 3B subunit 2
MEEESNEIHQIEIIPEVVDFQEEFSEFGSVFARFTERSQRRVDLDEEEMEDLKNKQQPEIDLDDEENLPGPEEGRLSKKKQRKASRMTVAQLKQMVEKPEVVEWVDVSAPDPFMLVSVKSTRNTIPVPSHWSRKSAYLSQKKGFDKQPFELPGLMLYPN